MGWAAPTWPAGPDCEVSPTGSRRSGALSPWRARRAGAPGSPPRSRSGAADLAPRQHEVETAAGPLSFLRAPSYRRSVGRNGRAPPNPRRQLRHGRAEHRLGLRAIGEGVVADVEHDRLLPGLGVEHDDLPADILEDEGPAPVDLPLEVEAADRVGEVICAADAPEEVLEHAAVDHRLAGHRVRHGLFYPTATDELDELAALVEEGGLVNGGRAVEDDVEAVAVGEDLGARLREA